MLLNVLRGHNCDNHNSPSKEYLLYSRTRSADAVVDNCLICQFAGLRVMEGGGNAADAAVAVGFCQGVMNPMASGLGGGAFILVRVPNGTAEFIDARIVAPGAATETMLVGEVMRSAISVTPAGHVRQILMAMLSRHLED